MNIDIYSETKKYGIIYTDPPWSIQKVIRKIRPHQHKQLDYNTLSLSEIKDIHKQAFKLCDDKCNVFMWTIEKFLHETERFMQELGFTTHCRMIWDKGRGLAPAFTIRFTHEYLIWFYKKGHILRPSNETRGKYPSVFHIQQNSKHSHKPEYVYNMIDDMFPNVNKLELFARNQKAGWDCWGNETNKFDKVG